MNPINYLRRLGNNDITTNTLKSRARRALWVFLPNWVRVIRFKVFRQSQGTPNPLDSLMHFFAAALSMRRSKNLRSLREFQVAGFYLALGEPNLTKTLFDFLKDHAGGNLQTISTRDSQSAEELHSKILPKLTSNQSAPLAMGLASMGLLKSAYISRCDSMIKSALEVARGSRDTQTVRRAIHKHLDDGDIEGAKSLVSKIRAETIGLPDGIDETFTALFSLPASNKTPVSSTDEMFRRLVNNKSVLLIGAAPIANGIEPEESHYDCIVRITPTVLLNQEQSQLLRRCDIAYLKVMTPHTLKKLEAFQTGEKLQMVSVETPKLIVMKKAGQITKIANIPVRNVSNVRSIAIGSPTSGTQAISDLLQYQPSSLDLVGFNFYTSQSIYKPEVLEEKRLSSNLLHKRQHEFKWKGNQLDPTTHVLSWASHDLASDFMFIKALVTNNNRVRAIGKTAEVLGWSLEQYFNRFSELIQGLD